MKMLKNKNLSVLKTHSPSRLQPTNQQTGCKHITSLVEVIKVKQKPHNLSAVHDGKSCHYSLALWGQNFAPLAWPHGHLLQSGNNLLLSSPYTE